MSDNDIYRLMSEPDKFTCFLCDGQQLSILNAERHFNRRHPTVDVPNGLVAAAKKTRAARKKEKRMSKRSEAVLSAPPDDGFIGPSASESMSPKPFPQSFSLGTMQSSEEHDDSPASASPALYYRAGERPENAVARHLLPKLKYKSGPPSARTRQRIAWIVPPDREWQLVEACLAGLPSNTKSSTVGQYRLNARRVLWLLEGNRGFGDQIINVSGKKDAILALLTLDLPLFAAHVRAMFSEKVTKNVFSALTALLKTVQSILASNQELLPTLRSTGDLPAHFDFGLAVSHRVNVSRELTAEDQAKMRELPPVSNVATLPSEDEAKEAIEESFQDLRMMFDYFNDFEDGELTKVYVKHYTLALCIAFYYAHQCYYSPRQEEMVTAEKDYVVDKIFDHALEHRLAVAAAEPGSEEDFDIEKRTLVFGEHKTQRTHGSRKLVMTYSCRVGLMLFYRIRQKFRAPSTSNLFFCNQAGKQGHSAEYLTRFSRQYLNGASFGTNDLRISISSKAYDTDGVDVRVIASGQMHHEKTGERHYNRGPARAQLRAQHNELRKVVPGRLAEVLAVMEGRVDEGLFVEDTPYATDEEVGGCDRDDDDCPPTAPMGGEPSVPRSRSHTVRSPPRKQPRRSSSRSRGQPIPTPWPRSRKDKRDCL